MNVHFPVLTIGALAKAVGLTTPTIRYYEDIGLIPPAGRTGRGQRVYRDTDVERLILIRRCRDFGFSIDQTRQLLGLSVSADQDCTKVRDIASVHLGEVQAKLIELHALEQTLKILVTQCDAVCSGGAGRDCLVFKDISSGCC